MGYIDKNVLKKKVAVMTCGFIGAGNIATAIISGVVSQGYIKPEKIYIYDIDPEKCQAMSQYGVSVVRSAEELVQKSSCVFLTVKPQVILNVLESISALLESSQLIVSVAAGISIGYIKSVIGQDKKVVRVMPNTPLLLQKGASALVHCSPVSGEEFAAVKSIFNVCGITEVVPEEAIDAVTAVSGSAPAYVFRLAADVVSASAAHGLSSGTALNLFCQTLIGSAEMLKKSGLTPEELIRMVASPNGTTVAALQKLDDGNFSQTVKAAVDACVARSIELGKITN
jgi:pyrroline-5-carboxylate reductase